MREIKTLLISFCVVAALVNFAAGQTRRVIVNPTPKELAEVWQPNKEGCRVRYTASYKRKGKKIIAIEYSCSPIIKSVTLSKTEITAFSIPDCPQNNSCPNKDQSIEISTVAYDPEGDILIYQYEVSGGRIIGSGSKAVWDLSGLQPGFYKITVGVDDGCGVCGELVTKEIKVVACEECYRTGDLARQVICPQEISITSNREKIKAGEPVTFTVNAKDWNGIDATKIVFNWSVSNGEIIGGQGTQTITVKSPVNSAGQNITATISVGEEEFCWRGSNSATIEVMKPEQ